MSFRKRVSLRDEMKGIVEEPLLQIVPKRFDYIGNVAVISIPPELSAYKEAIASKLFSMRGNTRAVLNKVSKLEGEHRVADFELLLGETTETIHRENGYIYKLDVKKVFFNPRLYSERRRIASKITSGEHIIIPFAGVGPFVLPAAGKGAKVYAIEINPDACACLRENIRINRLEGQIAVIQDDFEKVSHMFNSTKAGEVPANKAFSDLPVYLSLEENENESFQFPENGFDRAIVPTPYGMDHFLGEISKLVRKGGYIHFYTFKAESQIPELIKDYEKMGLGVELYRRAGSVAPGISRWVFDLIKK
ncbi:class I SAM-dependent methyltransferase [Methanosarcina sp. UBA289]|uniref:class I SAM-dependent methyltransferase n=1 Tax=Methanosarcina sp. UBA289 TaxID=1915574 RepID=UPI0025D6BF60|nr:class I SAM-dependent methyltransferase family protein [Methanosarcina sp. UBA289]